MAYYARMPAMKGFFDCGLGENKDAFPKAGVKEISRKDSSKITLNPKATANLLRLFVYGFMEGLTAGILHQGIRSKILAEAYEKFEGTAQGMKSDATYDELLVKVEDISAEAKYYIIHVLGFQ